MHRKLIDINQEIVQDIVRVKADNLDFIDQESLIQLVKETAYGQIKDPDDAEIVISNILYSEYQIEDF
jgi:hypothetical protein